MFTRIKELIQECLSEQESSLAKLFAFCIQTMICLSLLALSLSTLKSLPAFVRVAIDWINWLSLIIFSLEYILRVLGAQHKRSYIFSFYGIVDLVAVLPQYLGLAINFDMDLSALKAFRWFRLFYILKLFRYNQALYRLQRALFLAKEELFLFALFAGIMLYLSSLGIYYFEHQAQPDVFQSVFHSMWWAMITFTTVGYGDMVPVTAGGKLFTFFMLIIGLGIVAIPTALISSALLQVRQEDSFYEKKKE